MSEFMGPVTGPRKDTRCEYGVFDVRCGGRATSIRQRPNQGGTWHVCDAHASFLDRLRQNIRDHSELLAKLRDADSLL